MDAQRRADITGWESREFSDGFDGLRRLADRGFTGAATDGTGWLFMLDGRVVGTVDADLDAFADASGVVYKAPHEAIPVLYAMQEGGGTERAQYYTNETPLSAADEKLTQGGFTGYIELSENVLSGDYYVAYTAGESMAAAYVGNSRRLETGADAFDLANDEVGIYTVYEADLDVRELPAPESDSGAAAGGARTRTDDPAPDPGRSDERATDHGADDGVASDEIDPGEATSPSSAVTGRNGDAASPGTGGVDRTEGATAAGGTEADGAAVDRTEPNGTAASDTAADGATADATDADSAAVDATDAKGAETGGAAVDEDGPRSTSSSRTSEDSEASDGDGARASAAGGSPGTRRASATETSEDRPDPSGRSEPGRLEESARSGANDNVFSEEEQWRETKSIPALDPSETADSPDGPRNGTGTRGAADGSQAGPNGSEAARSRTTRRESGGSRPGESATDSGRGRDDSPPEPRSTDRTDGREAVSRTSDARASNGASSDQASDGRSESVRERIAELESALSEAESERESLATERDDLRDERDRLRSEVEELRSEIDRLRDRLSEAESRLPDGERSLSAAEARRGTNLFVRYESKGGATLEDAHDGTVDRGDLRGNLRIEHHTSFDTEGLLVDGEPYEEFLRGTMEYGFTRWVVEDLPFEVSGTGNEGALRDLYDALPEINRVEIGGAVTIGDPEGDDAAAEERAFDLVLRDRMGNPLFAAELNDSREPTSGAILESLVASGGEIAESVDAFAGAFAVTSSFFEPDALEAASDAVGGGLFSRSKRRSFVRLSRKRGYHLCLVESRDGGFHLTVPDL